MSTPRLVTLAAIVALVIAEPGVLYVILVLWLLVEALILAVRSIENRM